MDLLFEWPVIKLAGFDQCLFLLLFILALKGGMINFVKLI